MSPSFSGLNLVFLGPAGSGRSTEAKYLAERFGIPHISSREILRRCALEDTELGRQARGCLERGELVSDEVMTSLMLQRLDRPDCARGFLIDGYPRTVQQAAMLDGILAELGRGIELVVLFNITEEIAINRLDGSSPEDVRRRLADYDAQTRPVAELYASRDQLYEVDATRSSAEVREAVIRGLEKPVAS